MARQTAFIESRVCAERKNGGKNGRKASSGARVSADRARPPAPNSRRPAYSEAQARSSSGRPQNQRRDALLQRQHRQLCVSRLRNDVLVVTQGRSSRIIAFQRRRHKMPGGVGDAAFFSSADFLWLHGPGTLCRDQPVGESKSRLFRSLAPFFFL